MEKKKISGLAIASFLVSICAVGIPFIICAAGMYLNTPTRNFQAIVGAILGVCAVILGIKALVVISKNKSVMCGYVKAIIGIIIGILSCYSWLSTIIWIA